MDVGLDQATIVQRPDMHERKLVTVPSIVGPQGNAAVGAKQDDLALATGLRNGHFLGPVQKHGQTIGFDQRVDGKGAIRLALAPGAVAAVNEDRRIIPAIMHHTTGAATFGHKARCRHV